MADIYGWAPIKRRLTLGNRRQSVGILFIHQNQDLIWNVLAMDFEEEVAYWGIGAVPDDHNLFGFLEVEVQCVEHRSAAISVVTHLRSKQCECLFGSIMIGPLACQRKEPQEIHCDDGIPSGNRPIGPGFHTLNQGLVVVLR